MHSRRFGRRSSSRSTSGQWRGVGRKGKETANAFCEVSDAFREVSDAFCRVSDAFCEVSDAFCEVSDAFREVSNAFREVSDAFREDSASPRCYPGDHTRRSLVQGLFQNRN